MKEVGRVVGEANPAENLACKNNAGDLCSAELESLKAIPVTGTDGELFLKIVGIDDSYESLHGVDVSGLRALKPPK